MVQAFAMMAMFFPELEVTKLVTMFVNSDSCEEFRSSGIFDVKEHSKVRPDRRTRTSYKFRPKEFWKEWKEFYDKDTDRFWAEVYPMEWSLAVRLIVAERMLLYTFLRALLTDYSVQSWCDRPGQSPT